jgi:hypothetical protein
MANRLPCSADNSSKWTSADRLRKRNIVPAATASTTLVAAVGTRASSRRFSLVASGVSRSTDKKITQMESLLADKLEAWPARQKLHRVSLCSNSLVNPPHTCAAYSRGRSAAAYIGLRQERVAQ